MVNNYFPLSYEFLSGQMWDCYIELKKNDPWIIPISRPFANTNILLMLDSLQCVISIYSSSESISTIF